jgi:hypothetical protein
MRIGSCRLLSQFRQPFEAQQEYGNGRGHEVIGMLTDRDIVTAVLAKDADVRQFRVGDVMTRSPRVAPVTPAASSRLWP